MSAQALPAGFAFQNSPEGVSLPSVIGIAAIHAGLLFALATVDRGNVPAIMPPVVTMQVEMIAPASATPPTPAAPARVEETTTPPPPVKRETPRPKRPLAKAPAPSPQASEVIAAPATANAADAPTTNVQESVAPRSETAASPAPAPVETTQARFDANYLKNPAPAYPAMSRRLGEAGRVVLRVFVDIEGRPEQIQLKNSSGFARLDQAAEDAVRRWKFIPAKRGDETVATWVAVPIVFTLGS
ncbi:MAG: energy transducer TonB [Propionivibrio sp.]